MTNGLQFCTKYKEYDAGIQLNANIVFWLQQDHNTSTFLDLYSLAGIFSHRILTFNPS